MQNKNFSVNLGQNKELWLLPYANSSAVIIFHATYNIFMEVICMRQLMFLEIKVTKRSTLVRTTS